MCGLVSHTDRFYRKFIDKRGLEGEKEWGLWLKAPPRRAVNQSQSRWLREEGDATWEAKISGETNSQDFRSDNSSKGGKEIIVGSSYRKETNPESRGFNAEDSRAGFKTNSNVLYGLIEEENSGLKFDERKRRREDPNNIGVMDIDTGLNSSGPSETKNKEADISKTDLDASITSTSAELALQASRFQ